MRELEENRSQLLKKIKYLKSLGEKISQGCNSSVYGKNTLTSRSNQDDKIALFRSLFRGREDVFPKRFESTKTGKSGYQPCCRNEWIQGVCRKPKIKCADCENRDFIPVTDDIIKNHLMGTDVYSRSKRDYTFESDYNKNLIKIGLNFFLQALRVNLILPIDGTA